MMKKPARKLRSRWGGKLLPMPRLPRWIPSMGLRTRLILSLIVVSNVCTHTWVYYRNHPPAERLYLMSEAKIHIEDTKAFAKKVQEISARLEVSPEWLMAVMYVESKFDASVMNHKGSGAVGLIQFMPPTAEELGVSSALLQNMPPHEQLDYVYRYLAQVKMRYGAFQTLTDLYLAVLYPKAINQDACYTLFGKPSKRYKQNSGLDENKDGYITVSDIEKRMIRMFPEIYHSSQTS